LTAGAGVADGGGPVGCPLAHCTRQVPVAMSQAHVPWPQSIVPASHTSVQLTAEQSGALRRWVQLVAWQHCAGTQSLAAAHVAGGGGAAVVVVAFAHCT